jgi:leucyl/phenylalanyl-tRNA--protein transferase
VSQSYYQLPTGNVAAIDGDCAFPPLSEALSEPNGLIAIGGDLTSSRLLDAYKQGIFPWFSEGEPIMWWSPNPRMVLFPDELKVSNSLKKTIKKQLFDVKVNTAFHEVISACSRAERPDQAGTWINHAMIDAYCELHDLGYAVSSECWLNNQLVGGCYGVKIGNMFYGESMFHTETDASKVAFVHLVEHLKSKGAAMIDCQMKTPLLANFGGREITRDIFIQHLERLT